MLNPALFHRLVPILDQYHGQYGFSISSKNAMDYGSVLESIKSYRSGIGRKFLPETILSAQISGMISNDDLFQGR